MRTDIVLPALGEGVTEAYIVEWVIEVGAQVAAGAPVVEVMTDKANVEVESPVAGTVVEHRFEVDARVGIGQVLAVVEAAG